MNMTLAIKEILDCTQGRLIIEGTHKNVNGVSIDTRNIIDEDIFFAIGGSNFDGNKYIFDAINKGVKLCIIDKIYFDKGKFKVYDVSIILVDDTLKALERLALYVRSKLNIKIIAVTGSVGKTTTKDLIYDFLSCKFRTYKTKGNFNNHIGMPLSLINIDDDAEIGIFEVGMSGFNEIDHLVSILKPHIGVITNIGVSHIEFLKSRENILKAKMEIVNYFTYKDILILNNEDDLLRCVNSSDFLVHRIGFSENCDMYAINHQVFLDGIKFDTIYNGRNVTISIPILGKHNILNALIALKICEIFNIEIDMLKSKFDTITTSSMRQEIVNYKDMVIINDCYNASPSSMKSGIDVLSLYDKEKVCILGDMNELGDESYIYHEKVACYAKDKIDKLIAIGRYKDSYYKGFGDGNKCYKFDSIDEFSESIPKLLNGNEAVLIKASRSARFERILDLIRGVL